MSELTVRPSVSVECKVPFFDCDPLFVVWHGRYFEYMARARAELMASLDLDVPQVRALGYRMYITDARCRYMFPMHYGDVIRVTAQLIRSTPLIKVAYDLRNMTHDRRTARASTTLATTDAAGVFLNDTPLPIRERLERMEPEP